MAETAFLGCCDEVPSSRLQVPSLGIDESCRFHPSFEVGGSVWSYNNGVGYVRGEGALIVKEVLIFVGRVDFCLIEKHAECCVKVMN